MRKWVHGLNLPTPCVCPNDSPKSGESFSWCVLFMYRRLVKTTRVLHLLTDHEHYIVCLNHLYYSIHRDLHNILNRAKAACTMATSNITTKYFLWLHTVHFKEGKERKHTLFSKEELSHIATEHIVLKSIWNIQHALNWGYLLY